MNSRSTDVARADQQRQHSIRRVAGELERDSFPRATLLGFVTAAGLAGFLSSAGGLALGVSSPALRYAVASLVGYLAFLLALGIWLRSRRRDEASVRDVDLQPLGELGAKKAETFGGGGGFSGGGSGGRLHAAASVGDLAPAAEAKGNLLGSAAGIAADADEGAIVLAPILLGLALVVGIAASASVIWQAPALLAEVLVDGSVAALVYQRVKARPVAHWTSSVLRRTWKPALAIAVALTAFGAVIPWLAPGADSIGDLFR